MQHLMHKEPTGASDSKALIINHLQLGWHASAKSQIMAWLN